MKKNLTELVFILDRSGSMSPLTDDTIGGFNSMIEQQKQEDGEAYVTTVLFDHEYELLHDHVNLTDIQPLTNKDYLPRGTTALLDAVGRAINTVGERLSKTDEDERPEKVVFVITTDGYENASTEFKKQQIKEMIEHQQSKYNWIFMFLGANMDAVGEASSYGINSNFARTYTASGTGTKSVYTAVANSLSYIRTADSSVTTDKLATNVSKSLDSVQ